MNVVPTLDIDTAQKADDGLWYKDAIIYQLHVKAFSDSNGDGIGDFAGLTERLDYLQDLGVTTLWLLPFYPSPGRDDGYDISDYGDINPDFGTMRTSAASCRRRSAAVCASSPSSSSITPRTSIPGSSARSAARQARARATGTSGATPTRNTPARASSSPTPRNRTGPGTRRRRPITGTASSRTSRILNFDNPRVVSAVLQVMKRWLDGRRRLPARRHALSLRARGHQQREPAGDPRRHQAAPRRARRLCARARCCSPRPTSGRRTCRPISATATNATWPITSR